MAEIVLAPLGETLTRAELRAYAGRNTLEVVESPTLLTSRMPPIDRVKEDVRLLVIAASELDVTDVRRFLAAYPRVKLREVSDTDVREISSPRSTPPPSSTGDPMIQISRGHAVPLSELVEDEQWGAHSNWVGQQALNRYRQTGDTGQ